MAARAATVIASFMIATFFLSRYNILCMKHIFNGRLQTCLAVVAFLGQSEPYVYSLLVAINERRTSISQYRVSVQCDEVFGGSCYIVEEDRLTWADARDRCVQLGGHLAIIESEAEDQFVFELAEGKQQQGPMIGRVKVYIYM